MGTAHSMNIEMVSARDELEKKLQDSDAPPMSLPLEFLKAITCDFSTESVLGEGGYGVVYKGVLRSGKIIAVKRLFEIRLKEETFQKEVSYLMGTRHQNVVKFVGYCAESSWETIKQPSGKFIWAEVPKRLLCFEYVCNKSLDKYISDESSGLEWNMRYQIMKGVCSGLHFLHEQCHIVHMDLKPENILMDVNMTPKIADFGLSRILSDQQSRSVTDNRLGSRGYMAPEYSFQGIVSMKADIFSLGVIIIEIITGGRDYPLGTPYFELFDEKDSPKNAEISSQQFIEKVLESWRNKFVSTPKYSPVEKYVQQVKQCISIALKCVDPHMQKRPTAKDMVQVLIAGDQFKEMGGSSRSRNKSIHVATTHSERENERRKLFLDWRNLINPINEEKDHWVSDEAVSKCTLCVADFSTFNRRHHCRNCGDIFCAKCTQGRALLTSEADSQPVRICDKCRVLDVHPLELHFPIESNKLIPCSLELINNTDQHVAFKLMEKSNVRMCFLSLPLYGIVPPRSTYTLIVTTHRTENLPEKKDAELILQNTICDEYIEPFRYEFYCDRYFEKAKELGNMVHKVILKAIYAPQGVIACEAIPPLTKILSVENTHDYLCSLDANQTEPWVITGNSDGSVSIWNYETQKSMGVVEISMREVFPVKFIARKLWFLAGSFDGFIHVYDYRPKMQKVTSFSAADGCLESLAIHPTQPYLLASSKMQIKLWDWDKGWECKQTFEEHSDHVNQVAFNPKDTNSFASASDDHTVKVWSVNFPKPMYTLSGHSGSVNCLDFFTCDDQQYLITGSYDKTAKIWDMQKRTCAVTLEASMSAVISVISHPSLPILITGTKDGDIHLWSSTNFRLKRVLNIGCHRDVRGLAWSLGLRRVVIGHERAISMVEIHEEEPIASRGNEENSK